LYDIKLAILNANFLLTKSTITGSDFCTAEAFDSLDLLIAFRYDQAVQDYYKRLYNLIQTFDNDGNLELIKTIQTFILCKGSYKETAKSLSQHENTIRYRLNRLRGLLGMEDDVILFHETMSVFVKLHLLFSKTV
ncbi:MAG: helix-turn-helix domain-containing protein, partial [Lachnospiraceae bacterium]|nr:helix-turn-helix domain-containing protein [Lachnospiraceae bacterium]